MTTLWVLAIATVSLSVLLGLAVYLALHSRSFEVEFKAFPPSIRIRAQRD